MHPISNIKVGQILISYLIKSYFQNLLVIFIIINSKVINYFSSNQDLFFTYTEYIYKFKIKIKEKITVYGYNNVNLGINNLKDDTTILTITNMS